MKHFTANPCEAWAIVTSGYRTTARPGHRGLDLGTPNHVLHPIHGARIFAPWDGRVTIGTEPNGAGQWVWVEAEDRTLFKCFHLSRHQVAGGFVKAGDVIGYVGNTGASQGAHYHVEVWVGGRDVNPAPFFDIPQEDDMALSDDDLAKIRAICREEAQTAAREGADKTNLAVGNALKLHLGDILAGVPSIRSVVDKIAAKLGA